MYIYCHYTLYGVPHNYTTNTCEFQQYSYVLSLQLLVADPMTMNAYYMRAIYGNGHTSGNHAMKILLNEQFYSYSVERLRTQSFKIKYLSSSE